MWNCGRLDFKKTALQGPIPVFAWPLNRKPGDTQSLGVNLQIQGLRGVKQVFKGTIGIG